MDSKTPYAVALMLTSSRYTIAPPYIDEVKAIKNPTEIQGFRNAYARDGAAMVRLFYSSRQKRSFLIMGYQVRWLAWLDEQIRGGAQITEWEAAEELTAIRSAGAHYWGLAYENISATGANAGMSSAYSPYLIYKYAYVSFAALPHYSATEDSTAIINTVTPYLKFVVLARISIKSPLTSCDSDSGGQYYDGTCDTTRTGKSHA